MSQLSNKIFTESSSFPALNQRKTLVTEFFGKSLNNQLEQECEYVCSLVQKGTINFFTGDCTVESREITWRIEPGDEPMSRLRSEIDNLVSIALNEFHHIPQVNNIIPNCTYEDKMVKFDIFINMPEYDDALMSDLAKTEVRVTKMAGIKGYIFNYEYIPV